MQPKRSKRGVADLFRLGLLLLASAVVAAPEASGAEPPPNFVVILADDMGYGDATCYWKDAPAATPNLDRMAAEGMRFTDFHSSGNVCSPTRAGLLTGRYQYRAGIPGVINADPAVPAHRWGLRTDEVTFAERLRDAGFRTSIFGKWHLGYDPGFNPVHHGFDEFRGYVSGNIDYHSHYDRMEVFDWWQGLEKKDEPGYVTHLVTGHAARFIRENRDRPFCLYVAHEAVHAPWQGPDDPPQRGPDARRGGGRVDMKRAFRDMMTELDRGVGEILAAVRGAGIEQRTLVFFFSDNGPAGGSAGPLRGRKGSDWEGGHRVPAIAWWPGTVPRGSVCDEPVISLDLMPTMLELAGVPSRPDAPALDGMSLVRLLAGEPGTLGPDRRLFWNGRAMREGPWKLMVGGKGAPQGQVGLYHLGDDPGEQKNLAADHPKRVAAMREALETWWREVNAGSPPVSD